MSSGSHIKNTFKHALVYGSAGIIGKAIGFIMLPIYSHHLQVEGYGVIGMIDSVLSVISMLIGYGISGAMSRFYYDSNDPTRKRMLVSTTIILMFFLVIAVTLPILFFSKQVAWLAFGKPEWNHYILLAVLAFMGTMTSKNAENFILIQQRSVFLSGISLVRLVFGLSLNIYFIVYLSLGVLGYLYASLIDAVVYTLFVHFVAFRAVGFGFDRTVAKEVLSYSLPMVPGYIAMFVRGNADRVLLRTFLGLSTVGVFEILFKFATLIGFFAVEPFSKIWSVKRFEVCEFEDGPRIMSRVFTYHLAILLFLGLVFSLEIPLVLKLLTPKEFWVGGFIVYFAVMSRVFNAVYYHLLFGLLYAKKTFKISVIQMTTAIISLVLTIPLVWAYGLMGAVVASLLSWAIQCVIAYFMAAPFYRIPFQWASFCRMLVLMTVLFWLGKDITIAGTGFENWLIGHLAPLMKQAGEFLWIDHIKDGKLLRYLVDGLPVVAEGVILFIYSVLFIVGLALLKIIPADLVRHIFHIDTLRNPSRIFVWS